MLIESSVISCCITGLTKSEYQPSLLIELMKLSALAADPSNPLDRFEAFKERLRLSLINEVGVGVML